MRRMEGFLVRYYGSRLLFMLIAAFAFLPPNGYFSAHELLSEGQAKPIF